MTESRETFIYDVILKRHNGCDRNGGRMSRGGVYAS
jgi:hypothetical protein